MVLLSVLLGIHSAGSRGLPGDITQPLITGERNCTCPFVIKHQQPIFLKFFQPLLCNCSPDPFCQAGSITQEVGDSSPGLFQVVLSCTTVYIPLLEFVNLPWNIYLEVWIPYQRVNMQVLLINVAKSPSIGVIPFWIYTNNLRTFPTNPPTGIVVKLNRFCVCVHWLTWFKENYAMQGIAILLLIIPMKHEQTRLVCWSLL